MDTLEETRSRLWSVARGYTQVLTLRPNVVGLILYGSLARGGLTRFSDIDIAVLYDEPVPPYWVEHRMTYGVRMDLLAERWEHLRALPDRTFHSLHEESGVSGYLMESLLLGDEETVLYDPTGEVRRIKKAVRDTVPFERLGRHAASGFFHYLTAEKLPEVEDHLRRGDTAKATERAAKLAQMFCAVLRQLTSIKTPEEAAERFGLHEFVPTLTRLHEIVLPGWQEMSALYAASRGFLDLFLVQVYAPLLERMKRSGVVDPPEYEFVGAHSFWWGDSQPRLWELGRAVGEWDYSLNWWGAHVEEGRPDRALELNLAGNDSGWYVERWDRLVEAMRREGFDVSDRFVKMRVSPDYLKAVRALDDAHARVYRRSPTPADAVEAVALVGKLHRVMAEGIPFLPPEELKAERTGE